LSSSPLRLRSPAKSSESTSHAEQFLARYTSSFIESSLLLFASFYFLDLPPIPKKERKPPELFSTFFSFFLDSLILVSACAGSFGSSLISSS